MAGLRYIAYHKPPVVLLEQVTGFLEKKHWLAQKMLRKTFAAKQAAVGDLGIFIKAAERCGGLEEFQDDLQVALKTMSQLARAYADYLAPWI